MTISFEKRTEVVTTPVEGVTIPCETTVCEPAKLVSSGNACAIADAPQVPAVVSQADEAPRRDQIIFPRLNVVQGSGDLKESFPMGAVVYAQSLVLCQPTVINAKTGALEAQGTPPAIITVLKVFPERFVEKVEGGGKGLIVNTEEAVRAAGGTLSFKEWEAKKSSGIKRFGPMADVLFAVERPEAVADDDTVFIYPVDGRKYAVALWSLTWTSYTAVAKGVLYTQKALGCLKNGYNAYSFALSTRIVVDKRTGNTYYVPVMIKHKPSTPAFLEFASEVVTSLG